MWQLTTQTCSGQETVEILLFRSFHLQANIIFKCCILCFMMYRVSHNSCMLNCYSFHSLQRNLKLQSGDPQRRRNHPPRRHCFYGNFSGCNFFAFDSFLSSFLSQNGAFEIVFLNLSSKNALNLEYIYSHRTARSLQN